MNPSINIMPHHSVVCIQVFWILYTEFISENLIHEETYVFCNSIPKTCPANHSTSASCRSLIAAGPSSGGLSWSAGVDTVSEGMDHDPVNYDKMVSNLTNIFKDCICLPVLNQLCTSQDMHACYIAYYIYIIYKI